MFLSIQTKPRQLHLFCKSGHQTKDLQEVETPNIKTKQ